jgi:Protein of unknown function, DUF481
MFGANQPSIFRPISRRIISVLWLALVVCPAQAEAGHGKVDRVVKVNGDVLTCEVLTLARGVLKVKTDGMGTITIEWDKISLLTSPAIFEVEVASGVRYFGSLTGPAPGKLGVSGAPAGTAFDLDTVVRITPIDQSFWRQLDGSVDVGYTFTQADQRSQWSFNGLVSRRTKRYFTSINANSLLTIEDAGTRQNRNTVGVGVQRQLGDRWFAAVLGQTDQNEQLDLDFRGLGGGAFGRVLVQSNRVLLSPFAGLTYTQERYVDQPVNNKAEGAFGVRLDWFTFGDYESDLVFQEQTYVDVTAASHVRVEVTTNYKQEIVKDLYWSVNLLESFNAAPPNNNKKNDLTLSMSLGWTF